MNENEKKGLRFKVGDEVRIVRAANGDLLPEYIGRVVTICGHGRLTDYAVYGENNLSTYVYDSEVEAASTPEPPAPVTERERILDEAKALVIGDREDTYGTPDQSLSSIAAIWTVLLGDRDVDAADVALLMAGLKLARLRNDTSARDGWVDLAGYAAIGAEVADAQ